jgi:PAS domain S-box-containing protein
MSDLLRAARDVAIALGLVAVAALLHMRFGTHLGGALPMSVCYLAVIAASALGGWRGGLAAVLAAVAMIRWVPVSGLQAEPVGVAFFVVISLLLVGLIAHARAQRHAAQMRQSLSERKLRAVFDTDMWGICFTDLEGGHWLANRAFRRMLLGTDHKAALGWERLPEATGGTGIRASLERRGLFGPREVELVRPDDSRSWVLLTAVMLSGRNVALLALDVTERKRVDEVLRTQRVLLRTIIDSVPAFVAYIDDQRRYRLHNRYFEHWHPGREIHGASLESVLEAELLDRIRPHLDRAFAGDPVRFQVCADAAGRARHFDVHFIPHRPGEKVEGLVVHAHDVTERFEAAERIAASEQRLRALAQASAAIVWHADRDGEMLDAPGWEVLTGQTREAYQGRGWMHAIHPDEMERVRAEWQRALASERPADLEFRVCTADRVARYIAMRAVPVPGSDGKVAEWIGTVRDVHERRMVEYQLRQAEADQRSLLENLPQMLWIADPDGRIRYHNRLWYEYTGLQPGDGWERVTHPDDLERGREAWTQALQHGEPLDVEMRFRRADGAYRWHMICGVPIYEERREQHGIGGPSRYIAHWYGASVDIEEQKRALETLAAANQRVSQFLAVLSHELRNPLSGVTTACELLAREDVDDARRGRALATMTRQSRHLQRIVDDLLDISRVTQGKIELRRERLDVCELLHEVRSDNQAKAEREGVTIEEVENTGRNDGGGCYVEGDRSRLRQVFENLVSNAIKASSHGQNIHLRVHCDEERVRAEVLDHGQGIAPDVRASLFDPFVQTPSWRSRGLGLGLDIVRKITELHHGTVSVASEGLGRGTCFTVRLPRVAAPASVAMPGAAPQPRGSAPGARGQRAGARVLIVDDELENAEALQTLLEVEGLDVRVAGDADEALAIWRQWPCQVMLCDLELPGALSGYDIARALHLQPNPPYLIAYSGYGQAADRVRTSEAGFQAHLIKPALLDEILHCIEEGLHRPAQAS